MQFFGVGILELVLILIIAMIVVGPERLPEVAAELAKWIRRARSYANYVARDFNDVIGELEKEVGASREDWKEIASVLNRQTSSITRELEKATSELQEASDVEKLIEEPSKVVPIDSASSRHQAERDSTALKEERGAEAEQEPEEAASTEGEEATPADEPWYVPGQTRRRRRSGDLN
jgi:sec-independent protein translocase protein TatB